MKRPAILLIALGVATANCWRVENPTRPYTTSCAHPARVVISVAPLNDPEAFGLNIDAQHDSATIVGYLQQIPGVSNIRQYQFTTNWIAADLRPGSIEAVRCVPGITQVVQSRTNIPPPR